MWKSGIIHLKKEILEQSGEKFACDIITQGQWAAASPFLCFNALNGMDLEFIQACVLQVQVVKKGKQVFSLAGWLELGLGIVGLVWTRR